MSVAHAFLTNTEYYFKFNVFLFRNLQISKLSLKQSSSRIFFLTSSPKIKFKPTSHVRYYSHIVQLVSIIRHDITNKKRLDTQTTYCEILNNIFTCKTYTANTEASLDEKPFSSLEREHQLCKVKPCLRRKPLRSCITFCPTYLGAEPAIGDCLKAENVSIGPETARSTSVNCKWRMPVAGLTAKTAVGNLRAH